MGVRDIGAHKLVKKIAENFRGMKEFQPPDWAAFVKTGAHKKRTPDSEDWWWTRVASVLRKIYLYGPVGVSRLKTVYGGRKRRGTKREHFFKSSGSIIRKSLQQLENAGFIKKVEKPKKGRVVTSKAQKFLSNIAKEVDKNG